MWGWWRRWRTRREARRAEKIVRWLKRHPDRIALTGRRIKEWSRHRGH